MKAEVFMYNENLIKVVNDLGIKKAPTQISEDLKVSKGTVSSYLNGKIKASNPFLEKFANFYKVSIDKIQEGSGGSKPFRGPDAIHVSGYNTMSVMEVPLVGYYAQAGYLGGFDDPEYLDSLPKYPFAADVEHKGEYICFEVRGDSMDDGTSASILERDILLCRNIRKDYWKSKLHINKWRFVIVHQTEGILVKQITNHDVEKGLITIHSLNDFYPDQILDLREISQIFNIVEHRRK